MFIYLKELSSVSRHEILPRPVNYIKREKKIWASAYGCDNLDTKHYDIWNIEIEKEATKLLKIAREGCGVEMKTNHGKLICGKQELFVEGEFKKLCCLKCQEAIKILEGILK